MNERQRFFYNHAGYSHGPDETPEQGHIRCADLLAAAEQALITGPYFTTISPDSEPWDGEVPWDGPVWMVTLYRVSDSDVPIIVDSVCGIGCEEGDPYLRVVAAEMFQASDFYVQEV